MKMFTTLRRRMEENHSRRVKEMADEMYQICEYDGVLWITFNGVRILPESMLADDALTSIAKMRDMYIKRHL